MQVQVDYLRLRGQQPLSVRFYDIPGISTDKSIGIKELQMFIRGEIKPNLQVFLRIKSILYILSTIKWLTMYSTRMSLDIWYTYLQKLL